MACAHHPETPEAFACTQCSARLCGACVKQVGLSQRWMCVDCGYEARKASPIRGDRGLARDVVARLFSIDALATAVAFAVFYQLAFWFHVLVVFYFAALVAYYFAIVQHVGAGKPGLAGPSDATEDWVEIGGFVLRGLACTALAFAPVIVHIRLADEPPSLATVIILIGVGQLYMPAALLAVAMSNSVIAAVWPVAWFRIIALAPVAYLGFVGLWLGSVAAGALVYFATTPLIDHLAVPGCLIAAVVWNFYWFAQAVLVGDFLRAHAAAFGWD